MKPRILIVGTVPYNTKSTSRAFEAYFSGWNRECLAQIFSNTKKPCKGHCESLYQITDKQMLQCWMFRRKQTGTIYHYAELEEAWLDNDLEVGAGAVSKLYRLGRKHTPLTHLLRGLLWRKCFWRSEKLDTWLEKFRPDCVFLSFSDDYFIPQIALYVANKFRIPIVSSIGDDYYFNTHFSWNPFYYLYKYTYRSLVRKVLAHPGSAIYISDKIRDKYNREFGLDGETVYLTSQVSRRPFALFPEKEPYITYFGNIRMGRNLSLDHIATALGKIDPNYRLHIYSNEQDEAYYSLFYRNPNAVFHGAVPYTQVQQEMARSHMTVVVEGFRPEDIRLSRYSLSTKAADALASGAGILAYGSADCGVIEYLQSTGAAAVCTRMEDLEATLRDFITDGQKQRQYYDRQIAVTHDHHNIQNSTATFARVVQKALTKEM